MTVANGRQADGEDKDQVAEELGATGRVGIEPVAQLFARARIHLAHSTR